MKKISDFIKKSELLLLVLAATANTPVFCAKKKKTEDSGQVKATYQKTDKTENKKAEGTDNADSKTDASEKLSEAEAVSLPAQKRTFFSKIDPEILAGVENGSPESLKLAMSKIRKNESEYEENEKILIAIAAEIMKTVWPSEKITWDVFPVSTENSYMGAIDSANKGVFDSSTGNTDFLSSILPCLVLLKPTSTSDVYEPCEESLNLSLQKNQNSVLANYLMGELQSRKNKPEVAVNFYKKAYDSSKNTAEIILSYTNVLRKLNQLDLAEQILGTIQSQDVSVLKSNAYLSFAKGDLAAAEEYVGRVLQQNPNDLEFLLFRAKILMEKNDYIHAVSLLDMYARQDNTSLEYLLLRARLQLDWSKNTSAATETVEKAIQLYPDNQDVFMMAARISSATDSKVAGFYADELVEKILQKDPENVEAMTYALTGLMQQNKWQQAYETCSKILKKSNPSSEIIYDYVEICINLGKYSEAYDFAKSEYIKLPNDELVLQSYIYAFSKQGSTDEVFSFIDSMLTNASPKLKSYLYFRRSYLQPTEESQLADLRSSLISNPRNSEALFRLYEIYFNKKDYRKAQYYLRQVVAINPNDAAAKKYNEELTELLSQ